MIIGAKRIELFSHDKTQGYTLLNGQMATRHHSGWQVRLIELSTMVDGDGIYIGVRIYTGLWNNGKFKNSGC